jgi:hypothetical protein
MLFGAGGCVLFREGWGISNGGTGLFWACGSELFDGGFGFQQNWDTVANGIDALALVTLQAVFATQHQRFAANGTGEDFQQVWADHDYRF